MNVKIMFFDVDQTLYDGFKDEIPASAILAIKQAQANGVLAIIATGRPLCGIKNIKALDVIKWDGYICSNGASYYDASGKLLKDLSFSKEQINKLFEMCQKEKISLALQSNTGIYAPLIYGNDMQRAYDFFNGEAPRAGDYQGEPVSMCTIYQSDEFDYEMINQIAGLKSIKGKANYADVINIKVNKGKGIKIMKELLNIKGESIAFGDADNDIELLELADIGVAMGNATLVIKKCADYITSSITEDGIYNALKHFNII